MDVYEAVTSRRAVRGFTDEPVSREVLERVLSAAAWSPSGSNIQPWNIYVVTGAPLARAQEARRRARGRRRPLGRAGVRDVPARTEVARTASADPRSARSATAHSALRARTGRRASGPPSRTGTVSARPPPCSATSTATWAQPNGPTLGMYLQTVMLLLRAEGLHSCPQMAWSQVRETVAEVAVTPGRAHPLLRHVDRLRGRRGGLRPHGPGAASRDGHVRRRFRSGVCQRGQARSAQQPRVRRPSRRA